MRMLHSDPQAELDNLRTLLPYAERSITETRDGSIGRHYAVTDLAAIRESIRTLETITKEDSQ